MKNIMAIGIPRLGFSLLEVVLALGLLGIALPRLLTYMAESTVHTEEQIEKILVINIGKSVQTILNETSQELVLDGTSQAYCGYKNRKISIEANPNNFDGTVFVLIRQPVETVINGSTEKITYVLYPWDKNEQKARLALYHVRIVKFVVKRSLGSKEGDEGNSNELA